MDRGQNDFDLFNFPCREGPANGSSAFTPIQPSPGGPGSGRRAEDAHGGHRRQPQLRQDLHLQRADRFPAPRGQLARRDGGEALRPLPAGRGGGPGGGSPGHLLPLGPERGRADRRVLPGRAGGGRDRQRAGRLQPGAQPLPHHPGAGAEEAHGVRPEHDGRRRAAGRDPGHPGAADPAGRPGDPHRGQPRGRGAGTEGGHPERGPGR